MIQRLQSLYLLFAALFVTLFLVFGEVWYTVVAAFYSWITPVALALGGGTALVALVAVFLYKNRQTQRKAILAAQWLDLAFVLVLVGTIVGISLNDEMTLGPAATSVYLTLIMPIVSYVFLRLARRGVEKDIALVRSMDRLR